MSKPLLRAKKRIRIHRIPVYIAEGMVQRCVKLQQFTYPPSTVHVP